MTDGVPYPPQRRRPAIRAAQELRNTGVCVCVRARVRVCVRVCVQSRAPDTARVTVSVRECTCARFGKSVAGS